MADTDAPRVYHVERTIVYEFTDTFFEPEDTVQLEKQVKFFSNAPLPPNAEVLHTDVKVTIK